MIVTKLSKRGLIKIYWMKNPVILSGNNTNGKLMLIVQIFQGQEVITDVCSIIYSVQL